MFLVIAIVWAILVALLLLAFVRDLLPSKTGKAAVQDVSPGPRPLVASQEAPVRKKVGPLPVPGPCRQCSQQVDTTTEAKPAWYDADQVGWSCEECQAALCGKCCSAKLQELKGKYRASGITLKKAIDNDPMALYFHSELAPYCPLCKKAANLVVARAR